MQSRPEYSAKSYLITNQTLHNFFINTSNVSEMNVRCPLGIYVLFKLSIQSVCQLQQHRIKVFFEMTALPYQWTPVAKHFISIVRQCSARQCWSVLACIASQYRTRTW